MNGCPRDVTSTPWQGVKFPGKGLLRPLGSPNRDKPFNDVLRIALKARHHSLRCIVDRLVDGAEEGNLHYIREIADRLDGKPVQGIDRREISINSINELTDEELLVIASGGRCVK
jgi:hypothetical protein